MGKAIKAKNFALSIEGEDGQYVPIGQKRTKPPEIQTGDFSWTFGVRMDWVNRWKLQAYLTPPL